MLFRQRSYDLNTKQIIKNQKSSIDKHISSLNFAMESVDKSRNIRAEIGGIKGVEPRNEAQKNMT